ncbi:MAG: alpha-galactosidase [Lachnospiraceae bacterium]|nr:alpha-galactosidase [Lachnospiraceae bacterium]
MGIKYFEDEKVFKLDSKDASYVIALVDEEQFAGHAYYGKKISDYHVRHLMRLNENPFTPSQNERERVSFNDLFAFEYPTFGVGDFRETCLKVRNKYGAAACSLVYKSHKIYAGKPALAGLPATFGSESECETLELTMTDPILKLDVTLVYTVFEDNSAITRSARIQNLAEDDIYLTNALSMCVDLEGLNYEMINLHGSWARERHIDRHPITHGKHRIDSSRGESSHQDHPFIAVMTPETNEDVGEVYGFNFVYSGNFMAQAEGCQFETTRVVMGINPDTFTWKLATGEEFICPEVVMVYSDAGLGKMTRSFHDLYRNHLIRGEYKDKKRPILINNWEATYFNFNTEKLLSIAKEASSLGIEMLVMDDGWFGKRNDDNTSLGDWQVNEEKLPGGLKNLVDEVNKLGMKFGIWFEPEMISPESNLYREHPDWAIQIPERTAARCRNQYVLDISRKEVRDYVYNMVKTVLQSSNIEYVKWDMNRPLSDLGSFALPADRQGELSHRYMLGVYEMQERLINDFPHLLLENCSGGGARFDAGMLYYSPQIWCSDDTDAIERLSIQQGTAMIYPLCSMGAHVSDCPNHTVGRSTPFRTRGHVALAGTFGYELDVTKIPAEDRAMIPEQVAMYHKYNDLVRTGDYYRIANYSENRTFDCYEVVAKDQSEALVTIVEVTRRANFKSRRIRLKGLQPDAVYENEDTKERYTGEILMYAGVQCPDTWGDYISNLMHFVKVN